MTEFVAHKVQIPMPSRGKRQQANHLVKCHTPVNDEVAVCAPHVVIHDITHETKYQGLVTHQSLIMGFSITDGLFF